MKRHRWLNGKPIARFRGLRDEAKEPSGVVANEYFRLFDSQPRSVAVPVTTKNSLSRHRRRPQKLHTQYDEQEKWPHQDTPANQSGAERHVVEWTLRYAHLRHSPGHKTVAICSRPIMPSRMIVIVAPRRIVTQG